MLLMFPCMWNKSIEDESEMGTLTIDMIFPQKNNLENFLIW
jgi:hypothetical protein